MKKHFWLMLMLMGISSAAIAQSRLEDAKALGWVASDNVCGGYFFETPMPIANNSVKFMKSQPVTITANAGQLEYNGVSTLAGPVVVTQPGRIVDANSVELVSVNGDYKTAKLKGHVVLREKGKIAIGKEADLDLQSQSYSFSDIIYRLLIGNFLSAWGKASNATQPPDGITVLKNVTYSTCPPKSRAWEMSAHTITLDQASGRGSAYNAIFYMQRIPVFYTPYINFPIDSRRQTGLLYPQFYFGGNSGAGMGLPFYWNIAPNYDDTFTPTYLDKRGFMFDNLFRYLTESNKGTIDLTVLPNDWAFRQFQSTAKYQVPPGTPGLADLPELSPTRSYFNWQDTTQWDKHWSGGLNYARVSDDYYPTDIGGVQTAAQNQLLQQGQITYKASSWQFLGNIQTYQTLHPVNQALVLNQYSMLPQLLFTSYLPQDANRFSPSWSAEFVNFSEAPTPGAGIVPPSGKRINIIPGVSLPLADSKGFITPAVQFEMTQYTLGDQMPGFSNQITRTVPIMDIDSGLHFERDTHLFGDDFNQTLEPRIFYLYVPYQDQHQIPVFDSSIQPFTFNQLFLTNRFNGSDRIGDANQISFALSTHFYSKATGDEKFSAGVGIIKYFEDRRVTLCQTVGCTDPLYSVGSTSPTAVTSPLVGQATYHFNPVWSATVDGSWDPEIAQTQNSSINFQYMPAVNHIVNVGYSYVRYGDYFLLPGQSSQINAPLTSLNSKFNLSEPTASLVWPLMSHVNLVASWSYSWNQNHSLAYFTGVQYDSCCWALQTVVARNYDGLDSFGTPQFSTGVYVQVVFKGLAKLPVNDPTTLLLNSIPNYQDNFAQV
ncbi:MAG TPA: LPS-assembly protein LptD [Gammaproteobacteria bacterium]|nr:LPS-assembly protein LptD [Gammaproteobacteria bacterium]